ncbi:otospiralin [Osmerus mordax]|uniref:otospiralin n=1 Tax=Osmerus mordax TaxID=8014 RepID=UPI00350F9C85
MEEPVARAAWAHVCAGRGHVANRIQQLCCSSPGLQQNTSITLILYWSYSLVGRMKLLVHVSIFLLCLIASRLCGARVIVPEGVPYDEPPAVPYWPYSTSDFWHYIEYFRSIGAYNHINEMARAFYAHQHLGDTLGYETAEGHEH